MPDKAVIQVRADAKTKVRNSKFFKRFGLSTSGGVRLLIDRAMAKNTLPNIPNAETQKAIAACRAGQGEAIPLSNLKHRLLGKGYGTRRN